MKTNNLAAAPTRRDALRVFALGGALIVAPPVFGRAQNAALSNGRPIGPFVELRPDNTILIHTPIPDMGTGVETALPMMIAEELDADWDLIDVQRMATAIQAGENGAFHEKYATQGSGGSGSVRRSWMNLRDCGALARHLIITAAAQSLGVAANRLTTQNSRVLVDNGDASYPYADFIDEAASLAARNEIIKPVEEEGEIRYHLEVASENAGGPRRKNSDDFVIVGADKGHKKARDIVTGCEPFGIDLDIDGQQYAVIARCPYFGGSVASYDDSAARAVRGVTAVIELPRLEVDGEGRLNNPGVAVVASSLWAAMKGRDALVVEWDKGPQTHENDVWHEEHARGVIRDSSREREILHEAGDFDAAYEGAPQRVQSTYTTPHFAHLNMETNNCAAHVTAERCIIATSHQSPPYAAMYAARATGLPEDKIEVRSGRIGCGLGRKWQSDFLSEAVFLSQTVGTPIKVFWTREDDTQNDQLNPAGRFEFKAGLDENRKVVAWNAVFASQGNTRMRGFPANLIPDLRIEQVKKDSRTPLGAWRGPGNNISGFAVEGFLNEVAAAADKDPLDLRLELLGEDREFPFDEWMPMKMGAGISTRKMKGVLSLAARMARWANADLPNGWGRGIASHFTFGSYVAFVVDVSVDDDRRFTVERVFAGVDCGRVINPLGARAQIESGIHDGLSTALYQNVGIEEGRITTDNFHHIRLLRIDEAPKHIEVDFIDSDEHPWGTGEIALPAFIPALMAALYDATGVRIRSLPIGDQLKA